MKKSLFVEIIALVFVSLFLYTGISKLMDFYVFRAQIGLSPLLAPFAKLIAVVLPCFEIVLSVVLFIPRSRRIGLYGALFTMILFTAYVIYILNFNKHLPCTCGGILEILSWKQHLIVNGALVFLAVTAIWLSKKVQ